MPCSSVRSLKYIFNERRCDMRENDPPARKIEREVEQQLDPKEVPNRESPQIPPRREK
jgi:hypothetical protein